MSGLLHMAACCCDETIEECWHHFRLCAVAGNCEDAEGTPINVVAPGVCNSCGTCSACCALFNVGPLNFDAPIQIRHIPTGNLISMWGTVRSLSTRSGSRCWYEVAAIDQPQWVAVRTGDGGVPVFNIHAIMRCKEHTASDGCEHEEQEHYWSMWFQIAIGPGASGLYDIVEFRYTGGPVELQTDCPPTDWSLCPPSLSGLDGAPGIYEFVGPQPNLPVYCVGGTTLGGAQ